MTGPDRPAASTPGTAGFNMSGDAVRPETLRQRADFLRAASARRQGTPAFLLQARRRGDGEAVPGASIRVGFTCSKKVGNAVARNRARRRLREVARLVLPAAGRPGWDYVLVGRPVETAARDFRAMQDDLRRALARVHADRDPPGRRAEGQGADRRGAEGPPA